jgi:hypothetical protein
MRGIVPVMSGVRDCPPRPDPARILAETEYCHMLETQAHLLVWTALVFCVSFAWPKQQAIEVYPMRASAGWLAGEEN